MFLDCGREFEMESGKRMGKGRYDLPLRMQAVKALPAFPMHFRMNRPTAYFKNLGLPAGGYPNFDSALAI